MTRKNKLTPWKLATFIFLICCIGLGITLCMSNTNDGFSNSRASEKTINGNNGRNGADGTSHYFKGGGNGGDVEDVN